MDPPLEWMLIKGGRRVDHRRVVKIKVLVRGLILLQYGLVLGLNVSSGVLNFFPGL